MPNAQINLIDDLHQHIKMRLNGVGPGILPRSGAICNLTIQTPGEVTVIPDAERDPRLTDNPFVVSKAGRFYAGAPLVMDDGVALGTICVVDTKPGNLTSPQRDVLLALARLATRLMVRGA